MSGLHILLVDDENDIREVAALSLQTIGGWRVSSASNGRAIAIALAAPRRDLAGRHDARPRRSGHVAAAAGRPADPSDPGDLSDGEGADRRPSRACPLGAAGTLTKPFDPMMLTDQINTILTRK